MASWWPLLASAVINGHELSPIYLQELTGAPAKGYQGHDEFSVVEGCLVRRFPIDKPSDSNAKATGGLRKFCCRLDNGEASWILRPSGKVLQFWSTGTDPSLRISRQPRRPAGAPV